MTDAGPGGSRRDQSGSRTRLPGLLVTAARVAAQQGVLAPGWVAAGGSTIVALGAGEPPPRVADGRVHLDAPGGTVLPGFIDVHVHGGGGYEAMDADPAGLDEMSALAARHGVTAFLPTTWTAGTADTLAALMAVARVVPERLSGARVVGAHMEGPYLNPERSGAQDRRLIRPADESEAGRFLDTGVVRLVTLAPEIAGNLRLVDDCVRRGITVGAGHTDATYDDMRRAVAAGVRHVTHTFNAQRPLHQREPGTVGAALAIAELACEVIADGVHVHPAVMRILHAVKGIDGMLLVTDATRPTGLGEGSYVLGDRALHVREGAVRLDDGTLAGSVLTFDAGLRTLVEATGVPAEALWPVTSRTPARAAGVATRKGTLAVGMDADLVVLGDGLEVRATVVEGRLVHRASALTGTAPSVADGPGG